MNKQEQVRRFTHEVLNLIKALFQNHRRRIEKQNSQKAYPGGLMKNEAAQSFYTPLPDIVQQLQNLQRLIKKTQKIRRERREMYDKKLIKFIQILQTIRKSRHLIKIKINQNLTRLPNQTSQIIEQAMNHVRNFQKESSQLCGKSYDLKPALQSAMTQLSQYGFLWAYLTKLQSITNDSVNEIYIPVNYDQSEFKSLINDVKAIWPTPQVIQKKIKVSQPPQIVKDDTEFKLRQAQQMLFGFTRPQNVQKALEVYHTEAQNPNSHPTALNALGDIYETGKYSPKDMNKAVKYYKRSADKNDPQGLYKIGQYLQKGFINSKQVFEGLYPNRQSQIRGGIQYYQKAAKIGHLDAMADLGHIYEKGVKIQPNANYFIQPHPQHALKYYLKAKKAQFPRGYNNLGVLLITCPSLSQQAQSGNLLKGIKYLQKAIELRYPKAYLNLAKCYENGVGVPQNLDKAKALYLKGAQQNDIQCKLSYVKSSLGFRIDDEKTLLKMVQITRQVLIQDFSNAEALYYMGLFLEQGIGMQKNIQSSLFYIKNAARLDYAPAITKLGDFYFTGNGAKKDVQYAKMLYQKAASKGDSKAMVNLGVMIQKGIGYQQSDPKKACQLYEEAAALGNAQAVIILSTTGRNILKPSQALKKANEMGSRQAAKILTSTHIFAPIKPKVAQTYIQSLKTLQNFYIKSNATKLKQ